MARNKLRFDIDAKDRTKAAFSRIRGSLGGLRKSIFSVQGALIGLGAGMVAKSFIKTAMDVENLQLRFKFLFKSAKEGAKAFDELKTFAAKVPFSLEQIAQGSGNLAVVTKDADELAKMLEITGNVAAVTGLDFRTTAEQIQRSFGAGIGAADLFRDRGVRALMGFKAGAKVTIEETKARFFELFGKGGAFGDAANEMANTFTGTLSMLGDKWFKFQMETVESAFFGKLKAKFGNLNDFLDSHQEKVTELAEKFGRGLAVAVENTAKAIVFLVEQADLLLFAFKTLIALKIVMFLGNVAIAVKGVTTAIWGTRTAMLALNAATKKNLLIGAAAATIANLDIIIKKFKELFGSADVEDLLEPGLKFMTVVDEFGNEIKIVVKDLEHASNIIEIGMLPPIKEAETRFQKIIRHIKETAEKLGKLNEDSLEKAKEKFKNIGDTIAKGVNDGISKTSNALARSIILGENLADTFKKMAQQLAVRVLSAIIEIVARKGVELAIEKLITREKEKQASLSKKASFSSMLPPPFNIIGSFLGFDKGGAVSKGKPIVVGERGPELFLPNQTGQITQNARGTSGSPINVNFNINTVDASGFEELLVRSRGTITQLINNAVNERGRVALI